MTVYPAQGWLPSGALFSWQHPDQGRDFVTNWDGIIQAPGDGVVIANWSDRGFPNGFGPRYPIVRIETGPFSASEGHKLGAPSSWNGEWYIGHTTSLVSPGQRFSFGTPLSHANQGHPSQIGIHVNPDGGWVELGMRIGNSLGPASSSGHWFDQLLLKPLVRGATVLGADHSTGGVIIGGTLRSQGFKGILRYAAEGRGNPNGDNVNISRAEADDLRANGIPIGIVCEHAAQFLLGGFAVGRERAAASMAVSRAAGIPDGVLYMAADWDCTNVGPTFPGSSGDRNMHAILSALEGAASVIGRDNVGFYGSYFAIDWLVHNAPWIKWFWCTEAWSHGLIHPRSNVYQRASSKTIAGVSCDIDVIMTANWGQRTGKPSLPKPADPLAIFPTNVGDPKYPNKGNERLTVAQCLGALAHPNQYRNYLKNTVRGEIKAYRDRCMFYAVDAKPPHGWGYHDLGTRWQRHNDLMKRIDAIK